MIVKIYLKGGAIIELPHLESVKATKSTVAPDNFTKFEWVYAADRPAAGVKLLNISLDEIAAITTEGPAITTEDHSY